MKTSDQSVRANFRFAPASSFTSGGTGYLNPNNPTGHVAEDPLHNADSLAYAVRDLAKVAPGAAGATRADPTSLAPSQERVPGGHSCARAKGASQAVAQEPRSAQSDSAPALGILTRLIGLFEQLAQAPSLLQTFVRNPSLLVKALQQAITGGGAPMK